MRTPQQIEEANAYRALVTEHAHMYRPEYVSAINALFDAAERFDALEEAHDHGGPIDVQVPDEFGEWSRWPEPLAELADRLKGKQ